MMYIGSKRIGLLELLAVLFLCILWIVRAGQNTSRSLIYSSGDSGLFFLFFLSECDSLFLSVLYSLILSFFFRLSTGGTLPWTVLENP